MEKNNKTAEEIALDFAERFQNNYPNDPLFIMIDELRVQIKEYASLQSSDKDERIKELESALKSAWKCINYLGDVLNSIDATTAEDVEFTDPLVSEVRSALNL